MASRPVLISCDGGNKVFRRIAEEAGFANGAQLPNTVYEPPLWFADQDWKRPDRARYVAAVAQHRPAMATVLDWEREDQWADVLSWADEIAPLVTDYVTIIPKLHGTIPRIPDRIGGKTVVLGYSVPTRYGGTDVPLWEFAGRPVHLLGGDPTKQLFVYDHMRAICDVVSVDGNYAQKRALRCGQFWSETPIRRCNVPRWPTLREVGDERDDDVPSEAFRRSCANIVRAWERRASD